MPYSVYLASKQIRHVGLAEQNYWVELIRNSQLQMRFSLIYTIIYYYYSNISSKRASIIISSP